MPRRVEDLVSRIEELEGEYERLLDEYVEVRQRLDYVESHVGDVTMPAGVDGDVDVDVDVDVDSTLDSDVQPTPDPEPHSDSTTSVGNGASESDPKEEASPEEIAEAVQEVTEGSEGNGVEQPGQDDIIIA